jgi:hypothetical protein
MRGVSKWGLSLSVVVLLLAGGCSSDAADVVLVADSSPFSSAELAEVQAQLWDVQHFEGVGRVSGPHGVSLVVTFAKGIYDECYGVIEGIGASAFCDHNLSPPTGSVILGISHNSGIGSKPDYLGVVVQTEPEVAKIRVATDSGETYEVPRLGDVSYIVWEETRTRGTLSLLTDDGTVIHVESLTDW